MRFFGTFLGLLGAIVMTTALGVFTTPEVDNTTSGLSRLQVPPPQTPARFRQATRAGLVARQARGPARRQNSAAPICNRPSTGTTPYAIFTDAFFATNHGLGEYAATLEKCYADCEARPGKCIVFSYEPAPIVNAESDINSLRGRHIRHFAQL